ncbi:hypothetical protein DY78_GL001971 [Lactiplantibacillus fabifermentans DSM 21115]|nr:hypothetical protein DY78_GL001971 [Lactiplantibacillus fabifermentans DSM 21115]
MLAVPVGIHAALDQYAVFSNQASTSLPVPQNPFTDPDFIRKHALIMTDNDFITTEILDDEF